jgi:hypothetical protein
VGHEQRGELFQRRLPRKVIIKGKVPVSAVARNPYLKRLPEPQTDTRTYQLCYADSATATSPYATTLELVAYEEWEVPDFVRCIRIKMANDEEFVIESQSNHPRA